MKTPWWKNSKGEWYVVIQMVLFVVVLFAPRATAVFPLWSERWQTVCLAVGLVIGLLGGGLIVLGIFSLGNNLTAVPRPKSDSTLVETGAYRVVRHPIYSGIILGAFGWAILQRSTLVLIYALVLFLFFDIKSRREEQWLSEKFSNYKSYQSRVKKLLPFVY